MCYQKLAVFYSERVGKGFLSAELPPDSVLGEGGSERVYKGWVDEKTRAPTRNGTGIVVAVKKLNSESMQGYEEWQVKSSFLFLSFYIFYYIKQQR